MGILLARITRFATHRVLCAELPEQKEVGGLVGGPTACRNDEIAFILTHSDIVNETEVQKSHKVEDLSRKELARIRNENVLSSWRCRCYSAS